MLGRVHTWIGFATKNHIIAPAGATLTCIRRGSFSSHELHYLCNNNGKSCVLQFLL